MFLVRYYDNSAGQYVVTRLRPAPTEVDYPDVREFTQVSGRDGGVLIQRAIKDSRSQEVDLDGLPIQCSSV
jgi:hypothetical protein